MTIPVVVAIADASREAALVGALNADNRVMVVRRCVDVADLLAVAASGTVQVAVVSPDLRRLDRSALARLRATGVATVGITTSDTDEARLRQLGLALVLSPDTTADEVADTIAAAADGSTVETVDNPPALEIESDVEGRLVAVWGPTGAPGRTTVAIALAAELAGFGASTMLVDADVYGGVIAQALGVVDDVPGLPAAVRAANVGSLDAGGLAHYARQLSPKLCLLSGIPRADRWPELRPAALEVVYELTSRSAEFTVVDCGFDLSADEELTYDTAAPQRNGATLTTLERADTVVVVGAADAIGMQRLVRALSDLRDAVDVTEPIVVVNRVRGGLAAAEHVRTALARFAGVLEPVLLPYDLASLDSALAKGGTLAEHAPGSILRAELQQLAARIADVELPHAPRGLFKRFRRTG